MRLELTQRFAFEIVWMPWERRRNRVVETRGGWKGKVRQRGRKEEEGTKNGHDLSPLDLEPYQLQDSVFFSCWSV